ncbi:MAG: 16S rRNA (cytosine(1402)-N(4))-methyltransferase RsmH [Owenweeksia sp.]
MEYHKPVLLHQCIDLLQLKPNGIYVDATFGGGGHSREIVKNLTSGHLYGFDQDEDAHKNALNDDRFTLITSNFRHLKNSLRFKGVHQVDGVLADLGISSHQIDEASRGFSLRFEGPLDMRMNRSRPLDAKQVINTYAESELTRIFRDYGELLKPHFLARAITNARSESPIETTEDLKRVLERYAPRNKHGQFWAKVFQAIRIEVNDEMGALHEFLSQAAEIVKPGGRLVIMAYHSLEDRPVKNFFRTGNFEGTPEKDFYGNLIRPLEPVTRKPIVPDIEETNENPRARSAKLRAAEKIDDGK